MLQETIQHFTGPCSEKRFQHCSIWPGRNINTSANTLIVLEVSSKLQTSNYIVTATKRLSSEPCSKALLLDLCRLLWQGNNFKLIKNVGSVSLFIYLGGLDTLKPSQIFSLLYHSNTAVKISHYCFGTLSFINGDVTRQEEGSKAQNLLTVAPLLSLSVTVNSGNKKII